MSSRGTLCVLATLKVHGSVSSLHKLHHKIKLIDNSLDGHAELTTARSAWREIVDGIERGKGHSRLLGTSQTCATEAQTREAFLTSLTTDVVNTLSALKVRFFPHSCSHNLANLNVLT